jgi:tRNA dimethylallyltransferase
MKLLVAIVGPTGIGKTRLALKLAKKFQGEIISADSRQVYRYMDIGTAKPTPAELASVPHHLIDVVNPDEEFNLALFQEKTYQAMDDIYRRGKLPFLVGGTGLYIKAIIEKFSLPGIPPDQKFRYNIEKEADDKTLDDLYAKLAASDPDAAAKIDRRNVRRLTRALEVHAKAGKAFSQLGTKEPSEFTSFIIGLTTDRAELYHKVDHRIDEMIKRGFIKEVEGLIKKGYAFDLPSMSGIGYRQIGQYLRGEMTLEMAIQKIKTETHRFIRHQYAWFRLTDERIHWFDVEKVKDAEIEKELAEFLKGEEK